jgi:proteasome accessory factor C
MVERASDRLLRMLGEVAYLQRQGDVTVAELARQFDITPEQAYSDIDTLWVSGTPGYLHDDLIDFDATALESGVVRLVEARGMTRPLRLGPREAVALLAALQALSSSLGSALDDERAAVLASATAKVRAVAGDLAGAVDVDLGSTVAPDVAAAVGEAVTRRRRLVLRYVDARDVTSEREVDPVRLVTQDDRTYLLAWSRAAGADRLFRLDRIVGARVLDEPAEGHDVPDDADVFAPDPEAALVTLHLASPGRWVAESAPVEAVRDLPDGSFEVDLRIVQPAWLRHLLLQAAHDVLDVRPAQVAADAARVATDALAAYAPLLGGRG